jgi:hypothetical protein
VRLTVTIAIMTTIDGTAAGMKAGGVATGNISIAIGDSAPEEESPFGGFFLAYISWVLSPTTLSPLIVRRGR